MIKSIYYESIQIKTVLPIKEHNIKPFLDIAKDIDVKKNGLFSFVLRCDKGKIVDYVNIENVKFK